MKSRRLHKPSIVLSLMEYMSKNYHFIPKEIKCDIIMHKYNAISQCGNLR